MTLVCAACLREGAAPPVYGTDRMVPGRRQALPAVTVSGGEALCVRHLEIDAPGG